MSPEARALPLKRLMLLAPRVFRLSVAAPSMVWLAVNAITVLLASEAMVRFEVMAKALAEPDATMLPFQSRNHRAKIPSSARPASFTALNCIFSGQRPVLLASVGSRSNISAVSYTHLRAHETPEHLV